MNRFRIALVVAVVASLTSLASGRADAVTVGSHTVVIGDSISNFGKDNLRKYRPGWGVDAINGSTPATLSSRIDKTVKYHKGKHPRNLVVELGTNYSSNFKPEDYRIVRKKLPKTRIIFVTPGRDPFVANKGQQGARQAAAYAYYMTRLANADKRMCIVPWADVVAQSPGLLKDGVHGTPAGEERWAREVVKGVDACVRTEP
jgi:lysophospholipase L1-like esterase